MMRTNLILLLSLVRIAFTAQVIPNYSITALTAGSQGYYFLVPYAFGTGSTTIYPRNLILDKDGKPVYYLSIPAYTSDFKIQKDGRMTYSKGNKFYIMDSTFVVKDSVTTKNGVQFDGHDLQILSNGHFLLLGFENVSMDLSGYNLFNGTNPGSATANVKCNVIQELDAAKNVVFEWHCKDHYNFSDVDPAWLTNPNNVDWTHANAVEMDNDGNILLSVRHFNEITKIKRSDSTIMWRLGGNANQFTFTNDASMFKAQHDIRRLANGNITLFDNGKNTSPFHPATAKEYTLNENTLTATLSWSFVNNASQFSGALGDVQRLSNGNTLINYGRYFNSNTVFNVVTPSGGKVFEIAFTDTLRTYRAFNYPTLPWDLKRPVVSCYSSGGLFYLDAGPGHLSYKWSNGATTQTIQVTAAGDYQVVVPKGQNGFIYSETFTVSDINNPCQAVGIKFIESKSSTLNLYPNPFISEFYLDGSFNEQTQVVLTDIFGNDYPIKFNLSQNTIYVQVPELAAGLYFITVNEQKKKIIKR